VTARQAWRLARRWLWLCALGAVLAAGTSYLVSAQLPRVYEGKTKLLLTPGQASGAVTSIDDVLVAERLASTYSELARTRPVIEAAIRSGGLDLTLEDALRQVTVTPLRDTQLLQVSVRASDPERAASLANLVAAALVQQIEASQTGRLASSREGLARQVGQLAASIAETTRRVEDLRAQPPGPARDGDLAQAQFDLAQLQQSHSMALRSYEDMRVAAAQRSELLSVIEPATPAETPVEPRMLLNTLLGAVVGFALGLAVAFLVEHLDDRVTSPERLKRVADLPMIGSLSLAPMGTIERPPLGVADGPAQRGPGRRRREPAPIGGTPRGRQGRARASVGAAHQATGSALSLPMNGLEAWDARNAAESFHLLRTNLQFAAAGRGLRLLLVTSADLGEGKTTTAANLSIVAAMAGQKVLLVDADLRRPSLHKVFSVPNDVGLASLLIDEPLSLADALVRTHLERLSLLPSGPLPFDPGGLLVSTRMRDLLTELREQADLVVVDSPPVLGVSDPAILAGLVDGTLLVVDARRTRGPAVADAVGTLRSAGAHILGAALSGAPDHAASYYHYYRPAPNRSPRLTRLTRLNGLLRPAREQASRVLPVIGRLARSVHGRVGPASLRHVATKAVAWGDVARGWVRTRGQRPLRVVFAAVAVPLAVLFALPVLVTSHTPDGDAARSDSALRSATGPDIGVLVGDEMRQIQIPAGPAVDVPDGTPIATEGPRDDSRSTAPSDAVPIQTDDTVLPAVPRPSPSSTVPPRYGFEESFADTRRGWPNDSSSTAWLGGGGYHLFVRHPAQFVAIGAPIAEPIRDVVVTATFRKLGGPEGGGYGVIVRDQGPGSRDGRDQNGTYLVFEVSDLGEFGAWRRSGDSWTDLIPWTRSDAVRRGGAVNSLTVQAVGRQLLFLVNGIQVASQVDPAPAVGGVGISVGGELNAVVLDRFAVRTID
jgi:succinoglycan biosynthesis transport protein ExoP